MQAPVLDVPDFSQQFVIETDASDMGIGAVLMHNQHPVAYLSKALGPRNQALSVYEKECMPILLAIEKWRSYLQHQPLVIITHHRSLQHLTEQRVTSKLQHKALIKLMDLQYTIQYKKGVNNAAADALSRCEHTNTVQAISECLPTWVQKLKEGYEDDDQAKQLLQELAVSPDSNQDYKLQNRVLSPCLVPKFCTPKLWSYCLPKFCILCQEMCSMLCMACHMLGLLFCEVF